MFKIGENIYIVSEEEINTLCWCLDTQNKTVELYQGGLPKYHYLHYKKITHTNDPKLEKLCGCNSNCNAQKSNLPKPTESVMQKQNQN